MIYDLEKIAILLNLFSSVLVYTAAGFLIFSLLFLLAMLVNCFRHQNLGAPLKLFWAVLMIGLWPAGPFVYGLLASDRILARTFSSLTLVSFLAAAALSVVLPRVSVRELYGALAPKFNSSVEHTHLRILSKENHAHVLEALKQLYQEINQPLKKWIAPAVPFAILELSNQMDQYLTDQVLSDAEAETWLAAFHHRRALGKKVVYEFLLDALSRLLARIHVPVDFEQWLNRIQSEEPRPIEQEVLPAAPPRPEENVVDPGTRSFRIKSGEIVTGTVTYENNLYYRVEAKDGKSRLVFKDELVDGN